ncbi:unnamed protein product [Lepeophtheirus salmonis]|uniref:Mitochondria-eating protein n=1 Tax=Lepeophtheirus salmonis TaxID=72036 RepID=A0A7R8D609_LEPSM|nr:unnamed protein product [Lepeophtheirus salmonis]CAF2984935.1 unnamed protein product [Lepeophtheirus salmonis]
MGLSNLRPEAVVWQLVKFFASQQEEAKATGERWAFCGPFISSCKRLLNILLQAEPKLKRVVLDRKRALMKAIESLGQHGMVGTSDEKLMNLHDALKLEFQKVQKTYGEALTKLETMSLVGSHPVVNKSNGTISGRLSRAPPIAQSHQRQLSLKANEIQLRLIKNKTLLNAIEPALENTALEVLLGILQKRIELDKECLFQFTQVKRESKLQGDDTQSVAPILMRYQRGCQQVLDLMKEVSATERIEDEVEENLSDISGGYHSDSESCVMTSGNSPFISKEARYNFLSRSIRLGSKHNFRSSIIASSICQDNLSIRSSSIGSVKHPLSTLSKIIPRINKKVLDKEDEYEEEEEEEEEEGSTNRHLVIHSSSGISSGSSDGGNEEEGIPEDLSIAGDESTICSPSICSSDTLKTTISSNRSTQRASRHLKPRGKPVLPSTTSMKNLHGDHLYHGVLKSEISFAQNQMFELQDNEKRLKETLRDEREKSLTYEKVITKNATSNNFAERGNFETDKRKARTELVRKYGDLYSTLRLETLDELDRLPQLVNSNELKNKLLFSVVVLSFRSITTAVQSKRDSLRRILQLPPTCLSIGKKDDDLEMMDLARKDIEEALSLYLRRAVDNFDLTKNVEEVCDQIWATLYDYPCLKSCGAIIKYVKECVKTAWGLVNQMPSYAIEYEKRHMDLDCHVRYHSSDHESNQIKTYLWPALFEGKNGPCVQKGVVIT